MPSKEKGRQSIQENLSHRIHVKLGNSLNCIKSKVIFWSDYDPSRYARLGYARIYFYSGQILALPQSGGWALGKGQSQSQESLKTISFLFCACKSNLTIFHKYHGSLPNNKNIQLQRTKPNPFRPSKARPAQEH